MITGTTAVLGLMGDPVAHSLSPTMHNAALQALGVDAVYLPFPVRGSVLPQALEGLEAIGVQGFNVTIPHKQAVMPLLKQISPQARVIGAVNTIYRTVSGWAGTNTDLEGFLYPLRCMAGSDWARKQALILGSGGAARAVIQGCFELGCQEVQVVGRTWEKVQRLQLTWPQLQVYPWAKRSELLPHTDLVINTTPIGMVKTGETESQSPLSRAEVDQLPEGTIVYDLIYVPNPTPLLQMATAAGLTSIDGLEMLIQQGAAALSIWVPDRVVPVEVMRQAARAKLGLPEGTAAEPS